MHAGECKASELKVIELRSEKTVHCVARLAGSRKAHRDVIKVRCAEVCGMAAIASG